MPLDLAQVLLADELFVAAGDKAAFALDGLDEALAFQVRVGALGGDGAHPQAVCQRADRRELLALRQLARDDLRLDLAGDLLVDGLAAGV